MNRFKAIVLSLCFTFLFTTTAQGATLGPASTYAELVQLAAQAEDGDVILISGELSASGEAPLSTQVSLRITSADGTPATVSGLQLDNAAVTFTNVDLSDSLSISGTSHVELGSGVKVKGSSGKSAVTFDGNGSLILYPESSVEGGNGGDGLTIRHRGGEFYAGIEGTITGGSGQTGSAGLTISNLQDTGTLMISGNISGGSGETLGGHAMNLYDLSGNAFVTVTGSLQGGDGTIGGDGIQLVETSGNVNVGIQGQVSGGQGRDYGGDAMILMNVGGASSVSLSGSLTGGNVTQSGAQPGTSLLVADSSSAARTRVDDCNLQDGRELNAQPATPEPTETPEPSVTPLPEITSAVDDAAILLTPAPTETITPIPTVTPTEIPAVIPSATPSAEPTTTPAAAPTASPAATPTATPAAAPTASPTAAPTATPAAILTAAPAASPSATTAALQPASPTAAPSA